MKDVMLLSEDELTLFQEFILAESGLNFEEGNSQALQAALSERLQKLGLKSYSAYYNFLKYNPEGVLELLEFFDLLTIGETHFFRNKPHFDALKGSILPEIIQKKMYSSDKSIRVWSAGCSRGDEAYSVAMVIMDILPDYKDWNISILGTDINRNALIQAKEAIYGRREVGNLPPEYLDGYFEKRGGQFILSRDVKELARFEYHNLAKGPFTLEGMQNLDIIFCRNVTIYFKLETTKEVIEKFYDCLINDGYLFIGHAETLWQITNKFKTVEFPQTFIYKKSLFPKEEALRPFIAVPEINLEELAFFKESLRPEVEFLQENKPQAQVGVSMPGRTERPIEEKEKLDLDYRKALKLFSDKKYDQSIALLDKIITQDKNQVRAYFSKANILANQAKYKEAVSELDKIIEVDNLYVEAYYLLGVLLYNIGDVQGAEAQFRKVIYIDPDIVLAYFSLGNVYLYQKKFSKAFREFSNAVRLLEKRPPEADVKFCEDLTVGFLLRACKNILEETRRKVSVHE